MRGRGLLIVVACYLAIGALILWPAPFGGELLSASATFVRHGPFPDSLRANSPDGTAILSDSIEQFEPWLRYAADAYARTGTVPLWKDSNACGAPLVGNAQSAVFWPPNLLAILLGAPSESVAWTALLKFALAGLGTWLLGRHLGLTALGAFLAGAVYAFGGFGVLNLLHPHTNVSALLPWLVLCADRATQRPSARPMAAVAAVAAFQHLAGHPETVFHCHVFVVLLVGLRAAEISGGIGHALASRSLLIPTLGLVMGAGAAALQILPVVEYLRLSESWGLRASMSRGSIWPAGYGWLVLTSLAAAVLLARRLIVATSRLASTAIGLFIACVVLFVSARHTGFFFDPLLQLAPDWLGTHETFLGFGNYVLANSGYAGAAVAIAIVGLIAGRPRAIARVAGATFALGYLLGNALPVLSGLLEQLPMFDVAANSRLVLFALFGLAMLAGLGLDALSAPTTGEQEGRWLRRRFVLTTSALVLASVVSFLVSIAWGDNQVMEMSQRMRGARPMRAGAVDQPDTDGQVRRVVGWVAADEGAGLAVLLFGRARSWPAKLTPIPADQRERFPGLDQTTEPASAFLADVPTDVLPPGTPYRVLCKDRGGTRLSGQLDVPDGFPRWLVAAAAPEGAKSLGELAGFLIAVVATMAACTSCGLGRAAARVVLVGVAVGSLIYFAYDYPPTVPARLVFPRSHILDALAELRPNGRHLTFKSEGLAIPPEVGAAYRLMEPVGYDALTPSSLARVQRAAMDDSARPASGHHLPASLDVDRRLLGLMAVRAFAHSATVPVPGEELLCREGDFVLTANDRYLPRARIVNQSVVVTDDEAALTLLRDPSFDAGDTVVLSAPAASDSGSETQAMGGQPGSGSTGPRITVDESDRVVVDVSGCTGGFLVLADTFYPGWTATVDGMDRELLRANLAFRAVPLSSGDRLVSFEYHPTSFLIGCIVSALGWAIICGCMVIGRRPSGGVAG